MIKIGDNVTIAPDVKFITHDNSIIKVFSEFTDVFGKIEIGNNCFVGANSIILPGVIIKDSCIIAGGSVVTKSFETNAIIAGNPAKQISSINIYRHKIEPYCINMKGISKMKSEVLF